MKQKLVLFIFILIASLANAQVYFDKIFQLPTWDDANKLIRTSDGGYIMIGSSPLYDTTTLISTSLLIKFNSNGDTVWSKRLQLGDGGLPSYSIRETSDGGYVYTFHSNKVFIVRIDSVGNHLWARGFDPSPNFNDHATAYDVAQTTDGGFILAGAILTNGGGHDKAYLLKTDSMGTFSWSKSYGGLGNTDAYCVRQTLDGGYIICGRTYIYSPGGYYPFLIKTDTSGNISWNKIYKSNAIQAAYSVLQLGTGEFAFSGLSSQGFYIVKTDTSGTIVWSKKYGNGYAAYSFEQTADNGYLLAGFANFGAYYQKALVLKADSNGIHQWSKLLSSNYRIYCASAVQADDGNYVIAAYNSFSPTSGYDFCLIKTDSSGNSNCGQMIISNAVNLNIQDSVPVLSTTIQQVMTTSYIQNNPPVSFTIGDFCNLVNINKNEQNEFVTFFPNPFEKYFTVSTNENGCFFSLFDESGRRLISNQSIKNNEVIDVNSLSAGLYIGIFTCRNRVLHKILIKQ